MIVLSRIHTILRASFLWFPINALLKIALVLTIALAILLIFRKTIRKYVSASVLTRVFGSLFLLFLLNSPRHWDMFDLSWIYGITPPFHIYLPRRIDSLFREIPDAGSMIVWLIVSVVYWLGVFVCGSLFSRRERKMRKFIRKNAQPCPDALCEQMNGIISSDYPENSQTKSVDLLYCDRLNSPCAVDLKHATIVLDRLDYDSEQLDLIFRHELAHIAAGHLVVAWRLDALRTMFWFHPLVHIAIHQMRDDMEFAADEMVIAKPETTRSERITYARLLTDLSKTRALSGAALYLTAGAELIQQRVSAVLHPSRKAGSWLIAFLILAISLHFGLLFSVGEPIQALVPDQTAALACLGNEIYELEYISEDFKYSSPLDGFEEGYRLFCTRSERPKLVCRILDQAYAASDAEIRLFISDAEGWRDALIQCAGAADSEDDFDPDALFDAIKNASPFAKQTLYRGKWRLTPKESDFEYTAVELVVQHNGRDWENPLGLDLQVYVRLLNE